MLGTFKVAKNLVAIYPIGTKTLITTAERKRRKWNITSIESRHEEASESWIDLIAKIIASVPNPQRTYLMLILPRSEYFFTKAIYPKHLEDNIDKVLAYNQSEHVFFKNGCAVLSTSAATEAESIIAALYWVKKSLLEHLSQEVEKFEDFLVIPDAIILSEGLIFSADYVPSPNGSFWGLFPNGENIHAIHLIKGQGVTESITVTPQKSFLWEILKKKLQKSQIIFCSESLDLEKLISMEIGNREEIGSEEHPEGALSEEQSFPEKVSGKPQLSSVAIEEIIHHGLSKILDNSLVRGFDHSLRVNLPKVPRWCYGLLAIFLLYVLFSGYMIFEKNHLRVKLAQVKKERIALEEQWKPIEQQIKTVEQMEQDKKNLETLTTQVIPIREFMEVLSTKTPKDTWINNFILTQGNKVILRGDSKSAVQYMGELSKIPGFTNVKFISPVRKDSGSDKEFFNIEITVDWDAFRKAQQAQ
ncbi:MAG: PilN domain-containing protein [Thermodesulforhabdaceae bacterium]